MTKKIRKAVFPVGGLGTRFLPATKCLPKEMLPVLNKPMIQHAFEEAQKAGIEEFIFITGRNKNAIMNHFDNVFELEHTLNEQDKKDALSLTRGWLPEAGNIVFVRQQQPLGLGHAVWCARNLIEDEPFAVLLADELFLTNSTSGLLKEMVDLYNREQSNIIGVYDVSLENTQKYGIVKATSDDGHKMLLADMIEKPQPKEAPSNTAIIGRYILDSKIFDYLGEKHVGSGGEIQLTDAMRNMLKDNHKFCGWRLHGSRFDCGNPLGYLEANLSMAMHDPKSSEEVSKMLHRLSGNLARD